MNSKEKLILLMKAKAKELSNLVDIKETAYFAPEDEAALNNLPIHLSSLIWEDIEDAILNRDSCGLDSDVCPFCLAYSSICSRCTYAKVHGNCLSPFSDYAQIINKLRKKFGDDAIALPSSFYKDIINQINQKELENEAE